jgi:hypothetical protein
MATKPAPKKTASRERTRGTPRTSRRAAKARLYTIDVLLIGGPPPEDWAGQKISRTIQIRGDQTLDVLHRAIFDAFDREEEHLYEFQFGKGPHDPKGPRYQLRGGGEARVGRSEQTKIDDLKLIVGRSFGYWFDFGDDWMHQIDVAAIEDAPAGGRFPKVTQRVGESPPQYPEIEE